MNKGSIASKDTCVINKLSLFAQLQLATMPSLKPSLLSAVKAIFTTAASFTSLFRALGHHCCALVDTDK